MELKIKINERATMLLEVEDEMSIAEFMGLTSLISKIDKYALNQKAVVREIKGTRYSRIGDEKKRELIKEWKNADNEEKETIAKREGTTATKLMHRIHYYKKVLGGGKK